MAKRRKKRPSWRDHTYFCNITIEGTHPIMFNRLEDNVKDHQPLSVDKTKVEDYLHWDGWNRICIPGSYLHEVVLTAGRLLPDSRNVKKAADGLFKMGIVRLTDLAVIGPACDPGRTGRRTCDYMESPIVTTGLRGGGHLDCQRRYPAFKAGWMATFQLGVVLAGHIPPPLLHEAISTAGRLVGIGWKKPTYGRFFLSNFRQGGNDLNRLQLKQRRLMWDACVRLPDPLWEKESGEVRNA